MEENNEIESPLMRPKRRIDTKAYINYPSKTVLSPESTPELRKTPNKKEEGLDCQSKNHFKHLYTKIGKSGMPSYLALD